MSTENENFDRIETEESEQKKQPWNSRFGSDENLKQRKYSRTSRNQPIKEASGLSKILLGVTVLVVLTPFLLYWFVKANTPTQPQTPKTAQSVVINRTTEATTTVAPETTTTAVVSGNIVQNNESTVSSVDINQSSIAEVTQPPVTEVYTEAPVTQVASRTHTISAGETWYGIARTYGVDVNALAAANGSSTDAPIYPGNTLIIP